MKHLIIFFIITNISLFSQIEIKGTIHSNDKSEIDLYDVIITDFENKIITSKTFYNKNFKILTTIQDSAILLVNALGYKNNIQTIFNKDLKVEIEMKSFSLNIKSVEVKGKRKNAVERVNGNLVINVANSSLENENSVIDVLKKSSAVIINPNGNINVIGKGNKPPLIVIDGIETDKNALDNLRPSQIKSIEIIKNPSAIYSADANSVINVITYNSVYKGWNLKFYGQVTKATHFRYYAAIDLGYNHKKYGFSLNYGYNPFIIREYHQYNRSYLNSGYFLSNEVKADDNTPNYHNLNAKFYYKFNDKTSINLSTANSLNGGIHITNNSISVKKDSILQEIIKTKINDKNLNIESNNSISFKHLIDTNGFVFRISTSFFNLSSKNNSDIIQNSSNLKTTNTSLNTLFSLQPSISYTFNKIKLQSTYGIRYENIQVNSTNLDIDNSNSYSKINENILASFLKFKKSIKKFDFSAGVRYEFAKSIGKQNDTTLLFDRTYHNLFPSASIQFNMAKNWQLYTSYSYKISRPGFNSLSAFNSYLDTLSNFEGNAKLLPEYTHLFDLGLSYMQVASLDFSYSKTKNPLTLFLKTENNSIKTTSQETNFDNKEELAVSLTIPYQTDFWTTYNVFGYSHTTFSSKAENMNLLNDMYYAIFYNEINYKKIISYNVTFTYFTKGLFGIYSFEPMYVLGMGLKSSLLNNRLNIYLDWSDILRTEQYNLNTKVNDLKLNVLEYNDNNLIRIGFTFKLNNAFKNLKDIKEENDNIDRFKKD